MDGLRQRAPQAEGRGSSSSPINGTVAGVTQLANRDTAITHRQDHLLLDHPHRGAIRTAIRGSDGREDDMSFDDVQLRAAIGAAETMFSPHRRCVGGAHTSPGRCRCTTWRSRCPPSEWPDALRALGTRVTDS